VHVVTTEQRLLQLLGERFFDVVPAEFSTHCAFTSAVSQSVLRRFGLPCQQVPCQVWHVAPDGNCIVGFMVKDPAQPRRVGKRWDGHAICVTAHWIIDAALSHFTRAFGLEVPQVVVQPRFTVPAQAISRFDLNETEHLWWYNPPPNVDTAIPLEPPDIVERHAAALARLLEKELSSVR